MENLRAYLAGPISGCNDGDARTWREIIKSRLGEDSCLDPMRRDYRGKEDQNVQEIVELDKIDIDNSNVLIVNAWQVSVGTSMEIMYAFMNDKPVITIVPEGFISPWLRYHSMILVPDLESAILALEILDKYQDYV